MYPMFRIGDPLVDSFLRAMAVTTAKREAERLDDDIAAIEQENFGRELSPGERKDVMYGARRCRTASART